MTADATIHRKAATIEWLLWAVVAVLAGAIGWLLYDSLQSSTASKASTHTFVIDQSMTPTVLYRDTTAFADATGTPKAYLRTLTQAIKLEPKFRFQLADASELRYDYVLTARAIASHTPRGGTPQTVWEQHYPVTRGHGTAAGDTLAFNDQATVPYAEYIQQATSLSSEAALTLPIALELLLTVTVGGVVADKPFTEVQTVKLVASLTDPIYTITPSYEEHVSGVIVETDKSKDGPWWRRHLLLVIAGMSIATVLIAGLALWRPWRRQKGRTAYERALAKIYRYHDSLIIHTSRPIELRKREIISVKTFDDLLNVSEELHAPIVANAISTQATQFVVLHETTIYVFMLGTISQRKGTTGV